MNIKELMEKYFKEVIEKDPEIKDEITTIFEAAVIEEVNKNIEDKKKEIETLNEKKIKDFKETLVEKLDEYINLSTDEFIEENKSGIESDIKVALAEKTFSTIKTLFTEASIEIPEDQKTVVADLEDKVKTLSEKLNENVNSEIDLKKQVFEYEKAIKFEAISKGLSETVKEKLLNLVENINCADVEEFEKKVIILKESIFEKKEDKKDTELLEDDDNFESGDLDKYLP